MMSTPTRPDYVDLDDAMRRALGYTDAAAGVMLVLALMAGVLWLQRRHDLGFLWMTLACASWSARALAYYDRNVYVSPIWFEQFNPFNILLTAVALCAATLATMEQRGPVARAPAVVDWRRRPRLILLFAIVSSSLAIVLSVLRDSGAMLARAHAHRRALGQRIAVQHDHLAEPPGQRCGRRYAR